MPLLTPFAVALGLVLGRRIGWAAPSIVPLFAFITFSGALSLTVDDARTVIRRPLPIFLFFALFHAIIPIMVRLLAGLAFPQRTDYVTGFILLFSIPTAVSGFIWTSIYRGNGPLSLALILIDTLLAPLTVSATVSLLMGQRVAVDTGSMFASLLFMVVIPSIAGIALNEASRGRIPKAAGPALKPLSKLLLVAVIALNVSRLPGRLPPLDWSLAAVAAACVAFTLGGFALGRLGGSIAKLPPEDTVALTFAAGMRNISAALVLAISFFPPSAAVPVVTGILFQQTLAALSGVGLVQKLVNRGHVPPKP